MEVAPSPSPFTLDDVGCDGVDGLEERSSDGDDEAGSLDEFIVDDETS